MPKKKMSLESAARQFVDSRAQKAIAEKKIEEAAAVLKPALRASPESCLIVDKFKFTLSAYKQDYFKLGEAKKKLALAILKPFIQRKTVERILPTYVGDAEELAAA